MLSRAGVIRFALPPICASNMFATACSIVRDYTHPFVLFRHRENGEVSTVVGSFIVINSDGWIITAEHIVDSIVESQKSHAQYQAKRKEYDALSSKDLTKTKRDSAKRRIKKKYSPNPITAFYPFWRFNGATLVDVHTIKSADVAVGRLEPFDPSWVKTYPSFKDPGTNGTFLPQGKMLCKIGYPFAQVSADYDQGTNEFSLQSGLPPLFPIEGILTRTIIHPPTPSGLDVQFVETSSPSLRGQSGGPLFDEHGTVWGITSRTMHYPLGFDKKVQHGGDELDTKNAFLHVGWAVHPLTVKGLLDSHGISYAVSAY